MSKQASPFLSRARARVYLDPSPEARDTVSFGLDDILLTAASDSEDFGPVLPDALPPSGQEAWPSAAYSELVDVLSRATEKLSLDWPEEPRESQASELDERFLSGPNSRPEGGSCPFSAICIKRSPDPGSSLFPPILPTRQPLTSPTLWVLWNRATPSIPVVEDTLAPHFSPSLAPWKSRPLLPTKPCRITSALIG